MPFFTQGGSSRRQCTEVCVLYWLGLLQNDESIQSSVVSAQRTSAAIAALITRTLALTVSSDTVCWSDRCWRQEVP